MACALPNDNQGRSEIGSQWEAGGRVAYRLGCLALGDSSRVLMMAVNKGAGGGAGALPPWGLDLKWGEVGESFVR